MHKSTNYIIRLASCS